MLANRYDEMIEPMPSEACRYAIRIMGVCGIPIRKGTHARLVVSIHLIQQSASVELDAEDVQPVTPGPERSS